MTRRFRRHVPTHSAPDDADVDMDAAAASAAQQQALFPGQRADKQLPYFAAYAPPGMLPPQYFDYSAYQDSGDHNEVLSRTEPGGARKPAPFPDSPVYYIRMPPTPYVFVPGLGYVSQPPAPPPAFSPFINLPVDFVANGKPTSVYWRPGTRPPAPPSQQDTPVTQLDQGPYVFNGRPNDLFVLRNTYNSLYNDALQNIYP
ncbi:Uncharacterized protein GBIM_18336 [Gryllus bimaculatus]|nr:Uncharacterized protein GBIM_18336 [Gryllus bimaculatus]